MAFFGVPWMIGGGQAQHSADVGRIIAHAAFGGIEGVVQPTDLAVLPLSTPGGGVRVLPGSCAVTSRGVGATGQMYVNRNTAQETVTINPTTSSGPRSDLLVAQVMDPFSTGEGWSAPGTPTTGPYMAFRVIQGVSSSTTTVAGTGLVTSAIALARIDIPTSTATIQASHIKDLRQVAGSSNRLGELVTDLAEKTWTGSATTTGTSNLVYTNTSFIDWPTHATWSVPVPDWASSVDFQMVINPAVMPTVGQTNGHFWGDMQVLLGSQTVTLVNAIDHNFNGDSVKGPERGFVLVAGSIPVTSSMRGTKQTLKTRGKSNDSGTAHRGTLFADRGCFVVVNLQFKNTPATS